MRIAAKLPLLLTAHLLTSAWCRAGDWPQFLGPTRNAISPEKDLIETWPSAGPHRVWRKTVGHGWSGPIVAGGKLILCHRQADQECIACLDSRTGNPIWTFSFPADYQDNFGFDDGPRATPSISRGRVYTFGPQGLLHCLDFESGKKLWSVDVKSQYDAGLGFFGMACSPLVEGDAVLLNIGGAKGAGIVAFDRNNGKLLWKTSNDEASYSSPTAATIGGRRYALFLTREGLIGVDPVVGDIRFQYPWHSRNRMSVNAATPLVLGDSIFLSSSYETGAILLRPREHDVEKLWATDDLLSNHYATSVALDGFLYGIHGRTDPGVSPHPKLRCVDLNAQKVHWETDSIGAASLILASTRLLILTEKGELVLANATPESFHAKGRAQVLSSETRAFPALADGFFYARSKDELVCLDLRQLSENE